MPANAVWGAVFAVTGVVALISPIAGLAAFLLVLPFPTAGIFRMAALIARDKPVALSDAFAFRAMARRALVMGIAVGGATVVLGANAYAGFASLGTLGWAFATLALWGLISVWSVGLALWPLLFDPLRAAEPIGSLIRLAATVIVVKPLRYAGLMLVLAIVLVASTIMFAALLTISVAFVALVAANYVLPAADRIEGRRTIVVNV